MYYLFASSTGQRGLPMFWLLPNFCYERQSIPDLMHHIARVFLMLATILVGNNKGVSGTLYQSWNTLTDQRHRIESEILNVFPSIWENAVRLPWRLTPDELQIVDRRVRRIVYPHHCETVGTCDASFWTR